MDFCFSKRELSFLDDLMPESKKKKLDDAQNKAKEEEVTPAGCSGLDTSLGLRGGLLACPEMLGQGQNSGERDLRSWDPTSSPFVLVEP